MRKFATNLNLSKGGLVASIVPGGPADIAGIRPGDRVLAANGHPLRDVIDFRFYSDEPPIALTVLSGGEAREITLPDDDFADPGVAFAEDFFDGIRECDNRCAFCFVHQLPRGLRKSLYLKDDDYRMSFLHGSFVTATNLTDEDRKRIVEQRLSPLYVSVHSTDDTIRRKLLGNPNAPPIMDELRWFAKNDIQMHTQIVVCPGINDGAVLENTIEDLYGLYPSVLSVGVVPVGLTAHRVHLPKIEPVTPEMARRILPMIGDFQAVLEEEFGTRFVWASDELYLLAGRPIPAANRYGDFPQLENGVGIVRLWLEDAKKTLAKVRRNPDRWRGLSADIATGVLAVPILRDFSEKLRPYGINLHVHEISNTLFGPSVTVAGLLAGRDILEQLRGKLETNLLLVPGVALRNGAFVDDVTLPEIEGSLGVMGRAGGRCPSELLDAIRERS